jgi:hypothetical protein
LPSPTQLLPLGLHGTAHTPLWHVRPEQQGLVVLHVCPEVLQAAMHVPPSHAPLQQSLEKVHELPAAEQQVPPLQLRPEQHCEDVMQELPADLQSEQMPESQKPEQQSIPNEQLEPSSLHDTQLPP